MTDCEITLHLDPFTICLKPAVIIVGVECEDCGFVEAQVAVCADCYAVMGYMYCAGCRSPNISYSEPVHL